MLSDVISFVVEIVGQWGYPGILVMMLLESSFFPFPSEIVMIPAGYLAHNGEMNMLAVVTMGIVGSLLGALLNYYLAVFLGRPFLLRYGKYFFVNETKFERVESFFRRHGEIGTFTGRLIPVVRQYISFPAGLARMKMAHFMFFTGLGAGIWVTILAWIGYVAGKNEELIHRYSREATAIALAGCILIVIVYAYFYRRKLRRAGTTEPAQR